MGARVTHWVTVRGGLVLLVLLAVGACTERRASDGVPLLVRVQQAQTTPSFTHAVLKVFRDEAGRPAAFVKATGCVEVAAIPIGASGRRRLELAVDAGGPYFLQFTGHNDATCTPTTSVAAALAPGVYAVAGSSAVVAVSATAVDRFVVLEPPAGLTNAEVVPRAFHTATILSDGLLAVAGGAQEVTALPAAACARGFGRCLAVGRATSGIHAFDAASGALILVGALEDRRFLHAAVAGAGSTAGRLVVVGGAQAATVAGSSSGTDAAFVRAEPGCTNPNDAAGSGCILASLESHALDGTPAQVGAMSIGRASLALASLGAGKVLAAGGRSASVLRGCASDAQCATGATCGADGRCQRGGFDCAQVSDSATVCPVGFRCEGAAGSGRCVKRGCASDEECGGCLASGGCTTGAASRCEVATGVCTKRGCQSDSECLGSNRRCIQGNCAQVACDGLSGCVAGATCDVRSGKCRPEGLSVDCSLPGQCDCRGDSDCAAGFVCQRSGEFAGRCRNVQTGCPATVCRRDESDPAQGPYFDASGQLRRDVNCESGQCVLVGCRADLDCSPGFLCIDKRCEAGRRVTAPSASAEVCDVGTVTLGVAPCQAAAALTTAREGAAAACLARDAGGRCTSTVLWGGNTAADGTAELRGPAAEAGGALTAEDCAASGVCAPALSAIVEDSLGALVLGGVAHQTGGGAQYRFLSTAYRVTSGSSRARLLPAPAGAARAGLGAAPIGSGVVVVGGLGEGFAASTSGGLYQPDGARYEEAEILQLNARRFGHSTTVLPDGRIVVIGGIDPSGPTVLSSVEIFTPRNALR